MEMVVKNKNICSDWGSFSSLQPNYSKIADNCNLWRNYDDINDSWQSVLGIIQHYATVQDKIQPFGGPGHWNDPDMVRLYRFRDLGGRGGGIGLFQKKEILILS